MDCIRTWMLNTAIRTCCFELCAVIFLKVEGLDWIYYGMLRSRQRYCCWLHIESSELTGCKGFCLSRYSEILEVWMDCDLLCSRIAFPNQGMSCLFDWILFDRIHVANEWSYVLAERSDNVLTAGFVELLVAIGYFASKLRRLTDPIMNVEWRGRSLSFEVPRIDFKHWSSLHPKGQNTFASVGKHLTRAACGSAKKGVSFTHTGFLLNAIDLSSRLLAWDRFIDMYYQPNQRVIMQVITNSNS